MARLIITLTDDKGATFEAVLPINFGAVPFNLVMENCGPRKIAVIKEIRAFTGWMLKESKDASEQPHRLFRAEDLLHGLTIDQFETVLRAQGAVVQRHVNTTNIQPIDLLKRIVDAASNL